MIRAVIFLAIIAFASAFKLKMAAEGFSKSTPWLKTNPKLDGMIGNADFDPLGLSDTADIKWMREAELKHGRVAMLATAGWLVQSAGIHLPDPYGIFQTKNPIDAFFAVGPTPWLQIVLFIGFMESINHNGKMTMVDMHKDSDRIVGEFSTPIYGAKLLKNKTPEYIADMKLKELQNGRLAMCAIGGLVHQTILKGTEVLGSFPNSDVWHPYLELNVFRQ